MSGPAAADLEQTEHALPARCDSPAPLASPWAAPLFPGTQLNAVLYTELFWDEA